MVNATCLAKLVKYIESENLKPMQPWSQRKCHASATNQAPSRYLRKLRKKIRLVLNMISGFEIVAMLKSKLIAKE